MSAEDWAAHVRQHSAERDFSPLQDRAGIVGLAEWGGEKPNRLLVYQQHRFRYDDWGNCLEKRSGAHEVRLLQWNAEHQLEVADVTRMERGVLLHERWNYSYDPFRGRLAKKRVSSRDATAVPELQRGHPVPRSGRFVERTLFAWDGNRLLLENDGSRQTL